MKANQGQRLWQGAMVAAALAVSGLAHAQDNEWVTANRIGPENAEVSATLASTFAYSHQTNIEARKQYLYEAFEEWSRTHPNVKVDVSILAGELEPSHARLLQEAASGRAPDIAMIEASRLPMFYKYLQPLDPYLTEAEINDWLPWTLNQGMKDPDTGELKYLWFTTNTSGFWYRKDLVESPPKSLEELAKVAATLKDEHGFRYGLVAVGGSDIVLYQHFLSNIYSAGGDLFDKQGQPNFGEGANRDAIVKVLDWWHSAVEGGIVPSRVADLKENGDLIAEMTAKSTPFVFGGTWLVSSIQDLDDAENWAFTTLPQLGGAAPKQVNGGWSWGVFTKDPAKQAALVDMVMSVYAGREGMAGWCKAGGYTPVRESVLTDNTHFAGDRFQSAFADAVKLGSPVPNSPHFQLVANAMMNAFQQVVLGSATPDEAVDQAWATVEREVQ